jgi:hypothetical protein
MATSKATQAILNANLNAVFVMTCFKIRASAVWTHVLSTVSSEHCTRSCYTQWQRYSRQDTMSTCRTQFSVGSQNLQDLPKNYIVADLISSLPANSQCDNTVYCEIHQTKKSSSIARLANALLVARVLVSNVDNTLSWNCLTLTISLKLS